jgi:hypothetical protein
MRIAPQAMSRFRLDLAHCFFKRKALAGDFSFGERRLNPAQLGDQRGAGALI